MIIEGTQADSTSTFELEKEGKQILFGEPSWVAMIHIA